MSRPASQVVDCISRQPAGVRKDNRIDSFRPSIFLFFLQPRKQGGCSCTSFLTLSCCKKICTSARTPRPSTVCSYSYDRVVLIFCCCKDGIAEVLICLINRTRVRRWLFLRKFVCDNTVQFPIGLTKVPTLLWLTWDWGQIFGSHNY